MAITLLKERLPWWARMGARAFVSHLPVDYATWRSLKLFRFGAMEEPDWAFEIFERHRNGAQFEPREGFGFLELGPGDSLFSAQIARALGASNIYLVDVGSFANPDMALYRAMTDFLAEKGYPASGGHEYRSITELLSTCSARYETRGLESLRSIPDRSIDFGFSNAVLQHVRRSEFPDTLRELRRILRDDGCYSHSIDLRDMVGRSLNHLRFSDSVWESRWMQQCGFYSNRIRYSELLEEFQAAGFDVDVNEVNRWNELPTPRSRLSPRFRELPEDELLVATINVILRPR